MRYGRCWWSDDELHNRGSLSSVWRADLLADRLDVDPAAAIESVV